jgi:predicted nuclease of predicted toxin-antitoxin system
VKFFLDHCVPNRVAVTLAVEGPEVVRLRECLPADSTDWVVLQKATELDAVLISLNGDFADITTYSPSKHGGIIAMQVRNRPEAIPSLMERLLAYLGNYPDRRNLDGKLLLVEPHRIRIRS